MAKKIFINLPVKDIQRSNAFFSTLGFGFNPKFSDEKGTCMVISNDIYIMLLAEEFFKTFTKKQVLDASKGTEVILALSADSRHAVDELVQKATDAGGTTPNHKQDHGYMYGWGFQDLDGHLWEVIYMEEEA